MALPTEAEILAIYRQTIGPLYGAVSRYCGGDRALAEDLVQETWMRALNVWRVKGLPDVPAAWLSAVARNLLLNHLRRRRPLDLDALPMEPAAVESTREDDASEIAAVIQRGLAGLTTSEAGLIDAFHLKDRSVAEIAGDMRISERAVEGRLRRARVKLRGVIDKTFGRAGDK